MWLKTCERPRDRGPAGWPRVAQHRAGKALVWFGRQASWQGITHHGHWLWWGHGMQAAGGGRRRCGVGRRQGWGWLRSACKWRRHSSQAVYRAKAASSAAGERRLHWHQAAEQRGPLAAGRKPPRAFHGGSSLSLLYGEVLQWHR